MTQQGIADRFQIIDTDSHVCEPADLWATRVSSKWGDYRPHVVFDEELGIQRWVVGNDVLTGVGFYARGGWPEFPPSKPSTFDEIDEAAWDPKVRLERMAEHGIFAQVMFPNLLGFHLWSFLKLDPALRLQCVQAYNDFQIEFCSEDPGRLIPLANLPFWDLDASVDELKRCFSMGHKGVNFGADFERFGLPQLRSEHWGPLLSLAEELELPINFHIGFNKILEEEASSSGVRDTLDVVKRSTLFFLGNATTIVELICSGICERYPRLNFISVESGCGYIPFLIEALDWQFKNSGVEQTHKDILLPSEYFKRQIYATFWFEQEVDLFGRLYPDNVMFESDFPHTTSLSPGRGTIAKNVRDTVEENLSDWSDEVLGKVLHDNAARLFKLNKEVS